MANQSQQPNVTPTPQPTPNPMPSGGLPVLNMNPVGSVVPPGAAPTGITPPASVLNYMGHGLTAAPSMTAAAITAGLNPAQANMYNQIMGTVQMYKNLNGMPIQDAKQHYKTLSSDAQSMIKAMYGSPAWTNTDNWITQTLKSVGKTALEAAASPLIALYKAAGVEGKIINAPYLFGRELTQGGSIWDSQAYKNAWNGTGVFDTGTLANLTKTYGKANAFIAEGVLKGDTPGKIIDNYGKVDGDLMKGLVSMLGNTKEFNSMMDEFRGAQVSPGRDAMRVMMNVPNTDSHFYTTGKWKYSTGAVDAFYEIMHDPLTYLTGGGSDAVEATVKGARLADKLLDPALRDATAEQIFAKGTKISNDWDNLYGPAVQRLAEADAAKDPIARAAAMENIRKNAPEINNPDFLELVTKSFKASNEFNSEGIKQFAKTMQGAQELHMGVVDGPTGLRMGIPVARRERQFTSGANRFISDALNGKITPEMEKVAEKKGLQGLLDIGSTLDEATQLPTSVYNPELNSFQKQITLGRRLTRMVQMHPGHEVINVMDDNVKQTANVFNRYLRLAGYPKYAADITTSAFVYANPVDRVTAVRGLYSQILNLMGVPEEKRLAVLSQKFGDTGLFATTRDAAINPEHLKAWKQVEPIMVDSAKGNEGVYSSINGPIHGFQGKPHIGGLDFNGPELAPFGFNFNKEGSAAHSIAHALGGLIRHAWTRKIVDGWAFGSIFPRMGTRGTIEQGIFHWLTAPVKNITTWSKGRAVNKLLIAASGDNTKVPFMTRGLRTVFGINPAKWIPEKSIYDQAGLKTVQGHLDKALVNGKEVWQLAEHADVIHALAQRIDRYAGGDPVREQIMYKILKHPSRIKAAEVNSISAKSAAHSGVLGGSIDDPLLTGNQIQRMLKAVGYKATGKFKNVDPAQIAKDLGEDALADRHFRNWAPIFKSWNRVRGDDFHFGLTFMKHNALRTAEDFSNALKEILTHFGVNPDTLEVESKAQFNKYKNFSMETYRDVANKGMSEVQSVVNRIQHALSDAYVTFHGSSDPEKFNNTLVRYIRKTAASEMEQNGVTQNTAIIKALDSVDHNAFRELTRDNHMDTVFKSDLEEINKVDWTKGGNVLGKVMAAIKQWAEKGPMNHGLEMMDAQINWLFNQPALHVATMSLNEKYLPMEREMFDALVKEGYSKTTALDIAERHFIELAEKNAANQVLKFVDTAAKQSNLAFTMRTTGRFYRAQEQYMRRIVRLWDYKARSLYRTRLLHLGIDNAGFIHKDQNGNPYITVPGDASLFHAINNTMDFFLNRPDATVVTPMFANFNMNLLQSSPSLSPDAGVPAFSGPLMSIPILGLKALLNKLPWAWSKEASTSIDSVMLGSKSANLTLSKTEPVFAQRLLEMLPKSEQDHQYASAAMMAIAYNAKNGFGELTPQSIQGMDPATYKSKAQDYIDNLHVTVNNILGLRALLGMLSPIAPTLGEKDVPYGFTNAGITNLSAGFNDILQGVMRNDEGLTDPYETALAIFTANNPGMSIFAVGKSDKAAKLLQSYTQNTENWIITHNKWVNNSDSGIANAAMIFAPDMGKYDANAYAWMQSTGMIKQKPLKDYLQQVLTAQDVQAYWNAKTREEALLATNDPSRNNAVKDAQAEQQAILDANPVAALQINDAKNTLATYQNNFAGLGALLQRKDFDIPDAMRKKMQTVYNLAQLAINDMTTDKNGLGVINAAHDKNVTKQTYINEIARIGGAAKPGDAPTDPQIAEALKSIIVPLLNNLSKTTLKAGITQ